MMAAPSLPFQSVLKAEQIKTEMSIFFFFFLLNTFSPFLFDFFMHRLYNQARLHLVIPSLSSHYL